MNIPDYTPHDLHINDGGEIFEFQEFISEVIRMELFENEIELGVCKKNLSNGTNGLSNKQLYHIKNIVDRYDKNCLICGENIPLNEVIYLDGDYCSYHQNQMDKDD